MDKETKGERANDGLNWSGEYKMTKNWVIYTVGSGGSGFRREDPPSNLPKSIWDGSDLPPTAR